MKILIVTPIFPPVDGGPARYSWELLHKVALPNLVEVISFATGQNLLDSRVSFISTSGNMFIRQVKLFWACSVKGKSTDIFVVLDPTVGLMGSLVAKLLHKKCILKFVGDTGWEEARKKNATKLDLEHYLKLRKTDPDFHFRVIKLIFRLVDGIIVPAVYLRTVLVDCYAVPLEKITVISNSVDVPHRSQPKTPNSLIVVARLVSWKNVDLVIQAVKKIARPKIKLRLVGEGPDREKLEKIVKKLGLKSKVEFLGRISPDCALEEIAKSQILILFSDYEGMPHVVLEALAHRTLVVASKISGTDEIIKSGETGLLVKPGDVAALATSIKMLLQSPKLRLQLAAQGVKKIKAQHTWNKNLKTLINYFHEVLAKA